MVVLVITTNQGKRYEAEVRDHRDANLELVRFSRQYLANHPSDRIVDASVISRGSIIARYHNGRLEDF
jgi:hypothetical protein